jgi:hypothetical protein
VKGGRRQKKTEGLRKVECGIRREVESGRRYETEGGRSLMQTAIVIWIFMNLPIIGSQ